MKIEIAKANGTYEIAVMPKYRDIFTVIDLTKPEIKQLIKRLEKAIEVNKNDST